MTAHNQKTQIIQISDTHFGTEKPEVTQSLADKVNAITPDALILSGDITQRAKPHQFQAAREFIDQLTFDHLLATPGNHDIPLYRFIARFTHPYRQYHHWLGDTPNELILDHVAVISLNSCNIWHYKNGFFSDAELDRAERFFTRVPDDYFKILVAHHPVDAILPSDEDNIAVNSEVAVKRCAKLGVNLIMGGHIHNQFVRRLTHRYPDLKAPVWVSQAGTAISARTRGGLPNSFTQLEIDQEQGAASAYIWEYCEKQHDFIAQNKVMLR